MSLQILPENDNILYGKLLSSMLKMRYDHLIPNLNHKGAFSNYHEAVTSFRLWKDLYDKIFTIILKPLGDDIMHGEN
jgi:hypothetical protein